MKSLFLAAALGLGSLGLVGLTPGRADASWLSEALHARYGPYSYGGYYVAPGYDYYAPTYVYPGYNYYAPPVYYTTPYYVSPGVSYYRWSGPRYYGHWGGYHHGDYHGWSGGHGGRGGHHHR